MGGIGDIFGGFGDAIMGIAKKSDAKKNEKDRLKAINQLDWQPAYASEYAPTFKKAESPVARSFIESFLSGANPAAIRPGTPGAQVAKATAQAQQNEMFGTPQERVARQRQLEQETPWKVRTPQRNVQTSHAQGTMASGDELLKAFGSKEGVRAAYEKHGFRGANAIAQSRARNKR